MKDIVMYNVKDIQEMFGVGRKKAYEVMHMNGFPSIQIDSMLLVERTQLLNWIDKKG